MKKKIRKLKAFGLPLILMLACQPLCQAQIIAVGNQNQNGSSSSKNAITSRKVKDVLNDLRSHYRADILFSDQVVADNLVPQNAVNLKKRSKKI